ncbi:MAG: heme-copper oxidase subunit III [Gemmatimonadales bacterium]
MSSEPSPFGVPSRKLGIWMFIVADAATFAAVLFAYGYLRVDNPGWTRPFEFWPSVANAILMTVILLTSSLTVIGSLRAAQAGRRSAALRWLSVTMILGGLFAVLHLREWLAMIAAGWRPFQNPLGGTPLVGATFFSITGLHLLHVVSGVVVIAVIAIGYRRGRYDASHIEATSLYWHFVDLVWMFVFPLVYLLNMR